VAQDFEDYLARVAHTALQWVCPSKDRLIASAECPPGSAGAQEGISQTVIARLLDVNRLTLRRFITSRKLAP
jgi:hypothetical protein